MRAPNALWMVGAIGASAAFSAAALGQSSTWGGAKGQAAAAPAPDAGPSLGTWGAGARAVAIASDAGTDAAGEEDDEEEDDDEDAGVAAAHAPGSSDDGGAGDAGGYEPGDIGFSVGLRGGYGVPFGNANGSQLRDVAVGMVPLGVDIGWFLTRHFYVGGYFIYGFGVVADRLSDQCNTGDTQCTATMYRFGVTARYHFAPAQSWDPWVGAGLGYELINTSASSQTDDSNDTSAPIQAFDVTLEAGLDFKPLHYLGFGPYVELATGPYIVDTGAQMHGWATFGVRFRTNL